MTFRQHHFQIAPRQPRMLAREAFSPRAMTTFNRFNDRVMLFLADNLDLRGCRQLRAGKNQGARRSKGQRCDSLKSPGEHFVPGPRTSAVGAAAIGKDQQLIGS